MLEYVLLGAVVAVATVSAARMLTNLRDCQVPKAFCRATKAMLLDKKDQELQTEMNKCLDLNGCAAQ